MENLFQFNYKTDQLKFVYYQVLYINAENIELKDVTLVVAEDKLLQAFMSHNVSFKKITQ